MNFTPNFTKPDQAGNKSSVTARYEPVSKYMARDYIAFYPDQSIQDVIDILLEHKISGGPVLNEKNELIGLISERDCLKLIFDNAYHNQPLISRKVDDYMTKNVKTLSDEADVADAANLFLKNTYRHFPVTDRIGRLVGLLTRREMLQAIKNLKSTTWHT